LDEEGGPGEVDFSDLSSDVGEDDERKKDFHAEFCDHVPSDDDLKNSRFSVKDDTDIPSDDLVDIGAEVCREIEAEEKALPSYDVGDILDEFRKGVANNIDKEDYATHYNLGIAYKEMGLWKEALQEFDISKNSSQYQLESFEMMGASALSWGNPLKAVEVLKSGLACEAYTKEKGLAILYQLGCAYEGLSEDDKAREAFQKVYILDSKFEDVKGHIKKLNEKKLSEMAGDNAEEDSEDLFNPSTLLDD